VKTVAIVGTLDTKGQEYDYIRRKIENRGFGTLTVHCGVFSPGFHPDISNEVVANAAGKRIDDLTAHKNRGNAMAVMAQGLSKLLPELLERNEIHAVIAAAGSGGTAVVTTGMRALGIGIPKLMVSTVAGGDVSAFVGSSDIIMMPSIVDVSGLNHILKRQLDMAVSAICGMLDVDTTMDEKARPLVAASMFGVTTPCVDAARKILEENGYDVLVFHATGNGGDTMESLIDAGYFSGVLDLTTTEFCDVAAGGIMAAGPHRLETASKKGIPLVVSVGAVDMVNFGPLNTVPEKYHTRKLYCHNPAITLMRTSVDENRIVANMICSKLNSVTAPTVLLLPLGGISSMDLPGEPFWGPKEDETLFNVFRRNLVNENVQLVESPWNINDRKFAGLAAETLLSMMNSKLKK